MTREEIAALRALLAEGTQPPWCWRGNDTARVLQLCTPDRGQTYVMDFVRWGTRGAQPRFQVPPGHGFMTPAATMLEKPAEYRSDVNGVNHPDARLIVAAVNALPALLDAAERDWSFTPLRWAVACGTAGPAIVAAFFERSAAERWAAGACGFVAIVDMGERPWERTDPPANWKARAEAAERERDEARDERDRAHRARALVDTQTARLAEAVDARRVEAERERDALRAKLAAWRPIVEAAIALLERRDRNHGEEFDRLEAAVRVLPPEARP